MTRVDYGTHDIKFTLTLVSILFCLHGLHAADKPNVVIFYTDDQGTLDTGSGGSADLYTPNMDALVSTGIRFIQAYAHIVYCPSRAIWKGNKGNYYEGVISYRLMVGYLNAALGLHDVSQLPESPA